MSDLSNRKKNVVGWFEIYVKDMKRALYFYENVFDQKLEKLNTPVPEMEMFAFQGDMTSYGSPGALVKMPGYPTSQNSIIIYFSCADCSIEESRVEKFGGKIEKSKFAIGEYGFISLVHDADKNLIGLHSMK